MRVARLHREVLVTLAWAALGLLVVSVIGFFIMRDITVTLGRVVATANRIAIGDLSVDGGRRFAQGRDSACSPTPSTGWWAP